jgi:hypothetical protein
VYDQQQQLVMSIIIALTSTSNDSFANTIASTALATSLF